jgi:tetrahydromethanopterin S-methyltransferase subunit G
MPEPENMTLVLLREIRADFSGMRVEMNTRFNEVNARLDGLDRKIDDVKKAAFGESLVGRYMAAEVEERLAAIEARLAALEGRS